MLELKDYQVKSLEALESYLRLTAEYGARIAFEEKLHRDYRKVPFLPELPYVCLRVPTGGGKTLMACHALGIAARELLHQDRAFCLWLVPSNAIKDQTLAALRDRGHAYRQALESQFSGMVTVLDLTEALFVKRGDIAGETVIIVSTIQALRADDTEGRKVYESAGALQHHFDGLPGEIRDSLERGEKGTIAYSLANVMRLNRPVVIMDEAHNARTHRSFEMLARVNPAAIIEFTATPETVHDPDNARYASNILYHVSAAELKSEDMVKLPIKVNNRAEWKEAVAGAVQLRQELEAKAQIEEKATREYLRPITLYQAQERSQHRETITVDVLKKCLMEDFKVPEEEIAIATGQIREIDDVNLFQRECPIRHIITVKALREGWDCSFAYILCTVSTTAAAGAVEQILGRIMRMPGAKRKQQDELNFSYAFCASPKFQDAIGTLETALVECGFERLEARDLIKPAVKPVEGFFSLFDYYNKVETPVGEMPNLSRLTPVLKKQFEYKSEDGVIQFAGAMTDKQENELQRCFKTPEGKAAVETLKELSRRRVSDDDYPAGRGEIFQVPALSIRVDGQLELFEDHHFLDREFKLSECDATFSEQLFPQQAKSGDSAEVDVNEAGRLEIKHVEELQRQLNWLSGEKGWELPELVNWLDRHIPHPDITRTESTLFINSALSHLLEKRNFTIEQLAGRKY